MAYWLVKTEPSSWSWSDQLAAKGKTTPWSGVRNAQAVGNLKKMTKDDRVLFYHSGDDKQIVGVAEVVKGYYADPSDETGRFGMVDLKAVEALPKPVTLAQVKAEKSLQEIALVRQSRLSVMPIGADAWKTILKLGGL